MKGGDADEFIDYLMDGGASVRHAGDRKDMSTIFQDLCTIPASRGGG